MTDGRFSMLSGDTLPSMNSFLNLYPFLRKFSRIFSKVKTKKWGQAPFLSATVLQELKKAKWNHAVRLFLVASVSFGR